jgi:alpha-amylase
MDHPTVRRSVHRRVLVRRTALLAATTLAVGFTLAPQVADAKPKAVPSAVVAPGDIVPVTGQSKAPKLSSTNPGVMANLFEWNWNSIAKECTTVLGPAGYGGVQVAPPQDSVKRQQLGDGSTVVLHPWWEVYQPVSYKLKSRMGSEAQFQAMVSTCRKAGVKVYVDAVINHMTGQGNLSYGGVAYTKYGYNGLYGPSNFHQYPAQCPVAPATGDRAGTIADFNNVRQVRNCELSDLADLRTDTTYVRDTLATYLNKLIGYGVSGFRVDAAKHIGQTDLDAIYSRLHKTKDGDKPYWALEVFGGGPGILSPQAFTSSGKVLGLDADVQIESAFKSYNGSGNTGSIATLKVFGTGSGLPPSSKTLTFVQNHDTERNGSALNYKDGATNTLANEFLLASGYGNPQVYSSFTWGISDDSPPSDANGLVTATDCTSAAWACVNRDQGVIGMVAWHNYAAKYARHRWYDDGENVIAFNRGNRAWIALNNGAAAKTINVQTGLPAGKYCDVIHGSKSHGTCTGPTVRVRASGRITVSVASKDAVAFKRSDRI